MIRQQEILPAAAIILWSIIGSLGLIFGLGIVLYYHGKLEKLDDRPIQTKPSLL